MNRKDYVIGFMFSEDGGQVVLIEKEKPDWQKGKLNAPGGKIEPEETPVEAMVREFKEETGYQTTTSDWAHFARMEGNNDGGEGQFFVECFAITGDVQQVSTQEEEKIWVMSTSDITRLGHKMIENLPWLMHMAIDHLNDGRPSFAIITYP